MTIINDWQPAPSAWLLARTQKAIDCISNSGMVVERFGDVLWVTAPAQVKMFDVYWLSKLAEIKHLDFEKKSISGKIRPSIMTAIIETLSDKTNQSAPRQTRNRTLRSLKARPLSRQKTVIFERTVKSILALERERATTACILWLDNLTNGV